MVRAIVGWGREIESLAAQPLLPGVEAREFEQRLDEAAHPLRGALAGFERLAILGGRALAVQGALRLREDDRDGRAQFMRGVRGELLLRRERAFEPREGGVQHRDELAEFALRFLGVNASREIAGGNFSRRLADGRDGFQRPPCEPPAARQPEHDHAQPGADEPEHKLPHLRLDRRDRRAEQGHRVIRQKVNDLDEVAALPREIVRVEILATRPGQILRRELGIFSRRAIRFPRAVIKLRRGEGGPVGITARSARTNGAIRAVRGRPAKIFLIRGEKSPRGPRSGRGSPSPRVSRGSIGVVSPCSSEVSSRNRACRA